MSVRPTLGAALHPALLEHTMRRSARLQNRVADRITRFAGSMLFVYVHILWFGLWVGFRIEHYPFGLLTMIVSLEAIFLSTFVMISQNRADEKRQVLADNQWQIVQTEENQNEQLIELSKKILQLTTAIHQMTTSLATPGPPSTASPTSSTSTASPTSPATGDPSGTAVPPTSG